MIMDSGRMNIVMDSNSLTARSFTGHFPKNLRCPRGRKQCRELRHAAPESGRYANLIASLGVRPGVAAGAGK